MFIFLLCLTSDDQLSDPSKIYQLRGKEMKKAPKLSKNKIFIFGLCSTSDDWPSNLSEKW